jgi:hypothetical protein
MSTSGTTAYNPPPGGLTVYAYNLIGIRPAAMLQEHLESALNAMNMMLASWSNRGVNLWRVSLVTTPLVEGTATYDVDASVVVMLDAYIEYGDPAIDRIILPVSRTEYASYPNKAQEGMPTIFWFDRLLSPTVTLWPVPDGSQTSLKYYAVSRIEDVNMNGTEQVDIPPIWLEAFAYGLAFRLALIWAPDKAQVMKPLADEAYQIAAEQNIETSNFYVSPTLTGYFR